MAENARRKGTLHKIVARKLSLSMHSTPNRRLVRSLLLDSMLLTILQPASSPTAQIIFIHGFSDHSNRYSKFFPPLSAAGLEVHAFDQRGWGRSVVSPGEKGLTGKTPQVISDITSVIKSHLPSSVPTFLMGHSMGGQETLYYACRGPEDVKKQLSGFILLAPYLRLHPNSQPTRLKVHAGRLASKLMPTFQLPNKMDPAKLSHDAEDNKAWAEDPLCHDTGTLEGLADMLDRAHDLDVGNIELEDWEGLRILAIHGSADEVTSPDATKGVLERMKVGEKEVKVYEGCFHNCEFGLTFLSLLLPMLRLSSTFV